MKRSLPALMVGLAVVVFWGVPGLTRAQPLADAPVAADDDGEPGVGLPPGPARGGFHPHSRRHAYYYRYWPHYPYWYPYRPYGVVAAPIFVYPEQAGFGPGAVQRFMGVDHWFRPRVANPRPGGPLLQPKQPQNAPAVAQNQGPAPAAPPASAPRDPATERALLYVDYGDAHFANKKYADALLRYRRAVRIDAKLAEAHLHQGYALVALGKYDQAADAFKRGVQLDPDWPVSPFRAEKLYGQNDADKLAHRHALATASANDDRNTDLLFLLGISYYFDDQRDRAKHCFKRASQLTGQQNGHLQGFLKQL